MVKENCEMVAVYGVSKKSGKPYKALRVTIPAVDGGSSLRFYIFPKSYEWRLMGIKDEDFEHID